MAQTRDDSRAADDEPTVENVQKALDELEWQGLVIRIGESENGSPLYVRTPTMN